MNGQPKPYTFRVTTYRDEQRVDADLIAKLPFFSSRRIGLAVPFCKCLFSFCGCLLNCVLDQLFYHAHLTGRAVGPIVEDLI